jgi:hypothetical protein
VGRPFRQEGTAVRPATYLHKEPDGPSNRSPRRSAPGALGSKASSFFARQSIKRFGLARFKHYWQVRTAFGMDHTTPQE